jgi:hypothetical protein
MCERSEGRYSVTPDGVRFLEEILGIKFIYEPKGNEWQTLQQEQREHFTQDQGAIYCPHCGSFFHDDNPYDNIAAEFDYMDALMRPDENATLEYDRTCDECGRRYHLSVDASVKLYFTTTCEKGDGDKK